MAKKTKTTEVEENEAKGTAVAVETKEVKESKEAAEAKAKEEAKAEKEAKEAKAKEDKEKKEAVEAAKKKKEEADKEAKVEKAKEEPLKGAVKIVKEKTVEDIISDYLNSDIEPDHIIQHSRGGAFTSTRDQSKIYVPISIFKN